MRRTIVFYVPSFGLRVGGAERQAELLLHSFWQLREKRVFVVCKCGVFFINDLGIVKQIKNFTYKPKPSSLFKLAHIFQVLSFICCLPRCKMIVHFHSLSSTALILGFFLSFFAPIRHRFACVFKVPRTGPLSPLDWSHASFFSKSLFKINIKRRAVFVGLTPEAIIQLENIGASKSRCVLIPNGVSTTPLKKLKPWEKRKQSFLVVGRLIKRKKVLAILDAWIESGVSPDAKLYLIGDGPEMESVRKIHHSVLNEYSIIICGTLSALQIEKLAKTSRYFVLASDSEGLSNALLEAMSFGLVPIVRDIPENRYVVKHNQNGLLFQDWGELVICLKKLKQNSLDPSLMTNSVSYVTETFDIKNVSRDYLRLYDAMLMS